MHGILSLLDYKYQIPFHSSFTHIEKLLDHRLNNQTLKKRF